MQIYVLALYAAVYPALLAAVGILLASPRRYQLLTAFLAARMRTRGGGEGAVAAAAEPWSQRLLARGSVPIVVLASMVLNLPGAVYLVALKDIATGRQTVPVEVLQVIAFNLIMFLLAEIPWIGLMLMPERTDRSVQRALGFLGVHGTKIATGLCVVVGAHLIIRGVLRS